MNIKKIGMSALAGSLVAISANAAEMSVSGNAKVTYVTNSGGSPSMKDSVTGSPIGFDQFLGFNGSADNDYGTVALYTGFNVHGMAKSSSKLTIDMGDAGLIGFDGGTASFGLNAHKDMLPRAAGAEQAWDDTAGDAYTSGEATTGNIAYVNSFSGVDMHLVYAKNGGGNSADDSTTPGGDDSDKTIVVKTGTLAPGLMVGAGHGKIDDTTSVDTETQSMAFLTYAIGPVTLGAQVADHDKAGDDENITMLGIALNVNENISLSYNQREVALGDQVGSTAGTKVDHEDTGIAASYTMGGMTVSAFRNEAANVGGTSGKDDQRTQVALSFAF
jgi:outer membrane protein OmpU|tara:strand:- start:6228 stop:7220 length:993 start_codon:yes stop_codon:yes gene_type:complete